MVPLTAHGTLTARYWAVFDDDIIFGSRYLENVFRVNDEGYVREFLLQADVGAAPPEVSSINDE